MYKINTFVVICISLVIWSNISWAEPNPASCENKPACITYIPGKNGETRHSKNSSVVLARFKVDATIAEFYAPTPASDAVRQVRKEIAIMDIPYKWITDWPVSPEKFANLQFNYTDSIPVKVDVGYFYTEPAQVNSEFVFGEATNAHSIWGFISGPFMHYNRTHGVGDNSITHTGILYNSDSKTFTYTLYNSIGIPLTKEVDPKKPDGSYTKDTPNYQNKGTNAAITDTKNFLKIEAYSILNRYGFYCIANQETYHVCNGVIQLSPHVIYKFSVNFENGIKNDQILVWFNKFLDYITPTMVSGIGKYDYKSQ